MYEIRKDGAVIALTEKPSYIRLHEDGFYVLCGEKEAQGIAVNGTAYHLMNRPSMPGLETVFIVEIDAGGELKTAAEGAKMSGQLTAAAKVFVQSATDITDSAPRRRGHACGLPPDRSEPRGHKGRPHPVHLRHGHGSGEVLQLQQQGVLMQADDAGVRVRARHTRPVAVGGSMMDEEKSYSGLLEED